MEAGASKEAPGENTGVLLGVRGTCGAPGVVSRTGDVGGFSVRVGDAGRSNGTMERSKGTT